MAVSAPHVKWASAEAARLGPAPTGSYCEQNPCGDILSVRAPRANWCPGSETPPLAYGGTLSTGNHTFAFSISSIAGQWRVSATVYAYGD
jgi:hypothetical protein